MRRLRLGEHLHRDDRPRAARRHPDRGARLQGGVREEAGARRRRPGDLPVQDVRSRDGPRRAASAGRRGGGGGGLPDGGDRRPVEMRRRGPDGRGRPRDVDDRGSAAHRRLARNPAGPGHGHRGRRQPRRARNARRARAARRDLPTVRQRRKRERRQRQSRGPAERACRGRAHRRRDRSRALPP